MPPKKKAKRDGNKAAAPKAPKCGGGGAGQAQEEVPDGPDGPSDIFLVYKGTLDKEKRALSAKNGRVDCHRGLDVYLVEVESGKFQVICPDDGFRYPVSVPLLKKLKKDRDQLMGLISTEELQRHFREEERFQCSYSALEKVRGDAFHWREKKGKHSQAHWLHWPEQKERAEEGLSLAPGDDCSFWEGDLPEFSDDPILRIMGPRIGRDSIVLQAEVSECPDVTTLCMPLGAGADALMAAANSTSQLCQELEADGWEMMHKSGGSNGHMGEEHAMWDIQTNPRLIPQSMVKDL
jgi:hypothetical protein